MPSLKLLRPALHASACSVLCLLFACDDERSTRSDDSAADSEAGAMAIGDDAPASSVTGAPTITAGNDDSVGPAPPAATTVTRDASSSAPMLDAGSDEFRMIGAPLVFNPTDTSFGINVVLAVGDPGELRAFVSVAGEENWGEVTEVFFPAEDTIQWTVSGLSAATRYDYRIVAPGEVPPLATPPDGPAITRDGGPLSEGETEGGMPTLDGSVNEPLDAGDAGNDAGDAAGATPRDASANVNPTDAGALVDDAHDASVDASAVGVAAFLGQVLPDPSAAPGSEMFRGTIITQRPPGQSFSFALITDSHISPREVAPGSLDTVDFMEETLLRISGMLDDNQPDFLVNLGDMLDFHAFGFNAPPPDGSWTRLAYLNYRRLLANTLGNTPHFAVIGNWDGENGDFTEDQIAYSKDARLKYIPGPEPETYPFGGNGAEDYYAFTWGDASFIVLNVMTYTPTSHLLGTYPGLADDWTLGEEQLAWFQETIEKLETKWRFVLIHHAVGGAAGNEANSGYGRGGGQAAYVGEQALVHDLMQQFGVQVFFYGHDHVFTDMVVDGIHYTLPGSAGAPWKFTPEETGYARQWEDSGFAEVDVSPEHLAVRFVNVEGQVIYAYELE